MHSSAKDRARVVDLVRAATPEHAVVPEHAVPLTEAQSGLWYAQRLDPDNPIFNVAHAVEINGPMDVAAFKAAVNGAAAEAGALALRITETRDGPRQWIDEALRPHVEHVDVSASEDSAAAARAAMLDDLHTPVDPARGPLAANKLFRLAPQRHVWYLRVHHLAIDGYGMTLMTDRVAELYNARLERRPPAPAMPGFDVVIAEDEAYRSSPKRAADAAFWQEAFASRPTVAGMAPGRPVTAHRFHRIETHVAPSVAAHVRALADRERLPWPDVLTMLVALYCQRMTGASEAVVGVPHMGRFGSRAARVPAMVMNVLPLQVALDETKPLSELCGTVSKALARARKHGRYRSEQLRRDLGLLGGDRRLYGPLINVLPFDRPPRLAKVETRVEVLATGPVDDITFTFRGDLGAGRSGPGAHGAEVAMTLGAEVAMTLEVESNPSLYSREATVAHGRRLAAFLEAVLSAESLSGVATASPDEIRHVVLECNATEHAVPDTTLTALIEAAMRRTPNATAIVFENETLTYADLDARTAALAGALIERGIGRDDIVAVVLPRSVELIVALVAVLRAGAAYLPLDPEHPAERLRRLIENAGARCVLARDADVAGAAVARAAVAGADVARVDVAGVDLAGAAVAGTGVAEAAVAGAAVDARVLPVDEWPVQPTSPLDVEIRPESAAYVIFTSGSTGEPKGVVVEHRAIVNRLEWMREHYGFDADDRILQKTPTTFDVSVWELFLPLTTGATLVFARPGEHRDPRALAALMRAERITTAHFVPSMLAAFLAEPSVAGLELDRVFCSGEELGADLRDRFHELIDAELHNLYGPTEAAVDVSFWPASADDTSVPVPIGFPVWNTRLYVLDDRLRPLPAGVPGHLFIGGVQLARGYLGRPDLTEERFITDPFRPGERMYRTGDLAYRRDDDAIVFLGRSDLQIKVRGLRIEPGEIEAAMLSSGLVERCGVIAREDRAGDKRLVGYVIPGPDYDAARLRRHLAGSLPDYMIPAAFVELDHFPVTANGKLDRAALPAPKFDDTGGRPAQTPTERQLSELFAEVLGLDAPPGADGDFFSLGGDSLLAVQLMLCVQQQWGHDPGLGALFAYPTVAALAAVVDAEEVATDHGLAPVLQLAAGDASRPPVFFVHPAGGISWCYRHLARALAPKRAVYGLQAPALDPRSAVPESIDALAADYVERIMKVRPRGPYHVAGWSVGGIIAHAMAVRLRRLGHDVGLVAVLDAYPSDCWRAEPDPDEGAALRALLAIAGHDPEQHPELVTRDAIVDFLRRGGSPLGSLPEQTLNGVIRVVTSTNRLVRGHYHARYDGTLTHVRAALDHTDGKLVPGHWAPYVGALEVIDVPFVHGELTGVAATALVAPALEARLDAVDARVDTVEARLDALDPRLDALDPRLDALEGEDEKPR